ncbi:MAG: hypothetical protein ACI9BO_001251 [Zhongshania sp.]|jgi:hypothetical protein
MCPVLLAKINGSGSNPCALYMKYGVAFQGQVAGAACFYPSSFVNSTNPIMATEGVKHGKPECKFKHSGIQ